MKEKMNSERKKCEQKQTLKQGTFEETTEHEYSEKTCNTDIDRNQKKKCEY